MSMIRPMNADGSELEIEIKLRVESIRESLERLAKLPAQLEGAPLLEDNEIYDTGDAMLSRAGNLLRVRTVADQTLLTFKEKVPTDLEAKVRLEHETTVAQPAALRKIFSKLGLSRVYRYQKYRSYHGWTDPTNGASLKITVDDTPIGVFVELEGPKDSIDRAARKMGYTTSDYILEDYRSLHRAWLKENGKPDGDMVFSDAMRDERRGE
ncbi:MAG: class IV adenylate cyclase [Acidobacteriota bacterium]